MDERRAGRWRFQPTLRLIGGGNPPSRRNMRSTSCFNPPSASSAEGTDRILEAVGDLLVSTHPPPHRRRERLQLRVLPLDVVVSTHPPPHRRRELRQPPLADVRTVVSTHPPPHRRREPLAVAPLADGLKVSTHPPPHRRRELDRHPIRGRRPCFNPPSASSAEGTLDPPPQPLRRPVSTHPPPHRRREPSWGRARRPGRRRFQPTLRLIGGGNLDADRPEDRVGLVSTHPPPHRRRERGDMTMSMRVGVFQPTLRLIGGGNAWEADHAWASGVSTHPPPHRRRERDPHHRRPEPRRFNPPSASSAEGTAMALALPQSGVVSTHPPPHRRREHDVEDGTATMVEAFQPTLRLIGGGNGDGPAGSNGRPRFNPPSASSAEGTIFASASPRPPEVSTHPPPHRRRERRGGRGEGAMNEFQPTLRLIGGGNPEGESDPRAPESFNPPSASSAEGTACGGTYAVPINTFQPTLRLIGGGNGRRSPALGPGGLFQPTLRLIGGGNAVALHPLRGLRVSTHPPPHRRREPRSDGGRTRRSAFQPTLRLIGGGNHHERTER
mgnify:CR=1 FL=1